MTVKELIKKLQDMAPDRVVICSSDEEGNSMSKLHSVENDMVFIENDQCVDYERSYLDENGEILREHAGRMVKAIVLYPSN